MLINIYKNWPNDIHVGGFLTLDKFMDMRKTLMDKNEDVIASLGLMKLNESNNRVYVSSFLFFSFLAFFKSFLCSSLIVVFVKFHVINLSFLLVTGF